MADLVKIEIVYEVEGGEELGLYAEGHHDRAAFVAAVKAWRQTPEGAWLDPDRLPSVPDVEVRHETWRNEDGGEGYVFRPATPGEPGAYPVTCFAFEGGTLAAPPTPAPSPPETAAAEKAPLPLLSAIRFSAYSLPPEVRMPMTGTPVRTVLLALIDEVEAARAEAPARSEGTTGAVATLKEAMAELRRAGRASHMTSVLHADSAKAQMNADDALASAAFRYVKATGAFGSASPASAPPTTTPAQSSAHPAARSGFAGAGVKAPAEREAPASPSSQPSSPASAPRETGADDRRVLERFALNRFLRALTSMLRTATTEEWDRARLVEALTTLLEERVADPASPEAPASETAPGSAAEEARAWWNSRPKCRCGRPTWRDVSGTVGGGREVLRCVGPCGEERDRCKCNPIDPAPPSSDSARRDRAPTRSSTEPDPKEK